MVWIEHERGVQRNPAANVDRYMSEMLRSMEACKLPNPQWSES